MLNPWFADERKAMIEQWIESQDTELKIDIVTIEDINDPPNWVEHAKQFHGEGVLVSSDEMTLSCIISQILGQYILLFKIEKT